MSDRRQKLLITSLLVVLIVLTAQLWLSSWEKEDLASQPTLPLAASKLSSTSSSEVDSKHWEQPYVATHFSQMGSAGSAEPALNVQLQSVSLENGQWHAKITNVMHQVFDVSVGSEIPGLGKVLEVNNQHVLFQNVHLKTDIGFSHFKQELISSAVPVSSPSNITSVSPEVE